jgi:hypothetical protein
VSRAEANPKFVLRGSGKLHEAQNGRLTLFSHELVVRRFLPAALPAPDANAEVPQQSVMALALEQLRAEHQHVLHGLNAKDSEGRLPELHAPVPELPQEGLGLGRRVGTRQI